MTATAYPPSQKQFDFIKRLIAERDTTEIDGIIVIFRNTALQGTMTSRDASALIESLMSLPKKAAAAADEPEAGVYTDGTNFVRVYLGKESGRMLAKTIILLPEGVEYVYAGAATRVLTPNFRRMDVDEVGSLGKTFDHCVMCGRRLDDPVSVDRGIGPICADKYGA